MADFDVIVASGAQLKDWLDPPVSGQPSRINPRPGHPFRRWVGSRSSPVVLKAVVGGVVAPADGALGGRLFVSWVVEAPVMPVPPPVSVGGFSSTITFTAPDEGHYTIGVRRPDGGLMHIHLDFA